MGEEKGGANCCGQDMKLLVPNTVDAAAEKHVPVVSRDGENVDVVIGSVLHPALPEHHIEWIALETETQVFIKYIPVGDAPRTKFKTDETIIATYEYCNLHGLWKK
jgi:superoxide reductase